MSLQENVTNAVGSTKAVIGAAAGAGTTGASQMFGWIPDDIGKAASLAAILALLVPVWFALQKWKLEREKMKLEIEALKNATKR